MSTNNTSPKLDLLEPIENGIKVALQGIVIVYTEAQGFNCERMNHQFEELVKDGLIHSLFKKSPSSLREFLLRVK